MPAIQLGRLKIQAARLAEEYDQPAAFVKDLENLFDFYADRTHRSGQSGTPHPLIPAYNIPTPVLRQVLAELTPFISKDPQSFLILADELWRRDNLESRELSAGILGHVPVQALDGVISRARTWLKSEMEPRLIEAMLRQGLSMLRQNSPVRYMELVEGWLSSPNLIEQEVGLRGLLPLLEDEAFNNLPVVFRLITPYVRLVHTRLRPALLDVLDLLVLHSPQETAYFLRQNSSAPESADTPWVIRKVLKKFPQDLQANLRKAAAGRS